MAPFSRGPAIRVADALAQAQRRGLPRLDAQWLLGHLLGRDRTWLLAHDDQALTSAQLAAWSPMLDRRCAGEPLAYVVGEQLFCGLRLEVTPDVLIPRPETEDLVHWAVQCLQARPAPARVLDLGTGSGALALAIKQQCPQAQVWASDVSPRALAVAQRNAQHLMLAVTFIESNWWQAFPASVGSEEARDGFDLIVSNPPYIALGDSHLPALKHEPMGALVAGADGLDDLRQIIPGAPARLAAGGWLLVEHGHDQAQAVQDMMMMAGLPQAQTRHDLAGLPRCSGARHP